MDEDARIQQKKLYFLIENMQQLCEELPPNFQMRMTQEVQTVLANSLLNDTIYEIVKGLMEIQHVTEQHLQHLRKQVENDHLAEVQQWKDTFSTKDDKSELDHILELMDKKHKLKLNETDKKIVGLIDEKVKDQQSTLERAGIPEFYCTEDPTQIQLQMKIIDIIIRLSGMKFDPNK
ncbi:DGCR6 family protein [Megaselia abdita]